MRPFLRSQTPLRTYLVVSFGIFALLIVIGLSIDPDRRESSIEDSFGKRFKVYQVTATVLKNVANVHSNLDKAARRAKAGFDNKEINLLVNEQLAALDGTNAMINDALLAKWLNPAERKLYEVILNDLRDYRESWSSTFRVGSPDPWMGPRSVEISDDHFKKLNHSLYSMLDLEEKLSQEGPNRRPRALSAAFANLYPTFESGPGSVRSDQTISPQARHRSYQ